MVKDEEWRALSHFKNFLDVFLSDASQKVILFLTFVSQVEVGQVSLATSASPPTKGRSARPLECLLLWIALCTACYLSVL